MLWALRRQDTSPFTTQYCLQQNKNYIAHHVDYVKNEEELNHRVSYIYPYKFPPAHPALFENSVSLLRNAVRDLKIL